MMKSCTTHLPFAELSAVQHLSYYMATSGVLNFWNAWPDTVEELVDIMRHIWDQQQLTPADLENPRKLFRRIKPLLLTYCEPKPSPPLFQDWIEAAREKWRADRTPSF